jgi:hypothetical protein
MELSSTLGERQLGEEDVDELSISVKTLKSKSVLGSSISFKLSEEFSNSTIL